MMDQKLKKRIIVTVGFALMSSIVLATVRPGTNLVAILLYLCGIVGSVALVSNEIGVSTTRKDPRAKPHSGFRVQEEDQQGLVIESRSRRYRKNSELDWSPIILFGTRVSIVLSQRLQSHVPQLPPFMK
jgi:hypothetical protein